MKTSIVALAAPLFLLTSLSAFAGIRDSGGPAGDPSEMTASRYLPVHCQSESNMPDAQTTVDIRAVRTTTPISGRSYRFTAEAKNFGLGINVQADTELVGTSPVRFVDQAASGGQFDLAVDLSADVGNYHYRGQLKLPGRQTLDLICVFGER